MNYRSIIALLFVLIIVVSSPVLAQLDQEAIDVMEQQGVDEGWTFTVSENPATQYPLDQLCGMKEPDDWQSKARFDPMTATSKLTVPSAFDWRDYNGCTPIRSQGGCGSCWAFATVGALECAIMIREGVSVNLSEQWLVSCNQSGWDCDGGWYAHSYHGWSTDHCGGTGAVLESDFPYNATNGSCNCPYPHHYTIDNWAYIGNGSSVAGIEDMKRAILEYGPISVSLYAGGPFQGYDDGIYNYCVPGEINHSVVLVGWDDNQGQNGVWILRNSWGSWWGEGGYMRIEYGCAQVGYAACFVDYRPIIVSCDTEFGAAPLAVDFQYEAPGTTVTGLNWDFGDGDSSTDPNPLHTYNDAGCYTVTLTLSTSEGDLTKTCHNLISAHADTLRGDIIEIDSGGVLSMDIIARNNLELNKIIIPFTWDGPFGLAYDSFTVAGTRTEYFGAAVMISYDPNNDRVTISLQPGSEPPLPPGEGPVATLWFSAPFSVSGANSIALVTYDNYSPQFMAGENIYEPVLIDGLFHTGTSMGCCQGHVGDVNMSGDDVPTIGDISVLIDHLFISGPDLECIEEADVNQSGGAYPTEDDLTIGDVSVLIDHLFISGQPLAECL